MCYDSYVMTHMTLTVTSVDSTEVEKMQKLQKENRILIKMNSMQPIQKLRYQILFRQSVKFSNLEKM